MSWLGLDIGGANLKAATSEGCTSSVPFPLWQNPQSLAAALRQLIATLPPSTGLAVTMTGELADCFPDKVAGVHAILDAVEIAAEARQIRVYTLDGRLLPPDEVRLDPRAAAAANWHALARFTSRWLPPAQNGLLVDIGSTTTDVIRIGTTGPITKSRTDLERLLAGELIYTGVMRSPVCGLVERVPFRGRWCRVAQELFATTRDVHLLRGNLPEAPDDLDTADGRPATRPFAQVRLGRILCADDSEFDSRDAFEIARYVHKAQVDRILEVLQRYAQAREVADC
ncbi:MAG TPA: hydantoinase/oxoprolinase family protein, partial [Pirellulaceae bacterium]